MATPVAPFLMMVVLSMGVSLTIIHAESCAEQKDLLKGATLSSDISQLCVGVITSNLKTPRGMFITTANDILVLERGNSRIVSLHDDDQDGNVETSVVATASNLNHGIVGHIDGGFIYASSDSTVYEWVYVDGQRTNSDATRRIVVKNIPTGGQGGAPGGHSTRTLAFGEDGYLYISVGSAGNVDGDSSRARIRRFRLRNTSAAPDQGFDFELGEVWADGLRNEVGLGFDKFGVLWGVENSADKLDRADLGGDIHNDNPAEELNRFSQAHAGAHWGYPYCFTEFLLSPEFSTGRNSVWSWPSFTNDGVHTDDWCKNITIAPAMAMQAHSAPLGITFYRYPNKTTLDQHCDGGALPRAWDGDAFVAFHGSWNRDVPTGYKVVRIPMDDTGLPHTAQPIDVLWHEGTANWSSGIRPVDVKFDRCGKLYVTSDGTGGVGEAVLVIQHAPAISTTASVVPNTSGSTSTLLSECLVCKTERTNITDKSLSLDVIISAAVGSVLIVGLIVVVVRQTLKQKQTHDARETRRISRISLMEADHVENAALATQHERNEYSDDATRSNNTKTRDMYLNGVGVDPMSVNPVVGELESDDEDVDVEVDETNTMLVASQSEV